MVDSDFVPRITHDLYGLLVARKETFRDNVVSTEQLGELIDLVEGKKLTGDFH